MDLSKIKKLISLLPDGDKKNSLLSKLSKLENSNEGGLHDKFSLKPEGHICIEEIDSDGNVVGVLADQKNLVVKGSEEILLRAFSGDPDRILYKNRVLKGTQSSIYHVGLDEIIKTENGTNVVCNHPNELWKVVNDDEFEVEYSYYPNTLYVQEEASVYPNMKAFSIHSAPGPNRAPLTAEIYSTFTNMFIGIGDGESYEVPLNDERLKYVGNFTGDDKKKETTELNSQIIFTEKISNFSIIYEERNNGGKLDILINDSLQETIDTHNPDLQNGDIEIKEFSLKNLDHESKTEVKIIFSEADSSISNPKVVIRGIKFDAFSKDMNSLISEFENYTLDLKTPSYYNTTSVAPYTIQLEHYPVQENSVAVSYNSEEFEEVDSLNDLAEGKFYVDELSGLVYFNRALTDLSVSYSVTGQIVDKARVQSLQSREIAINVTGEIPEGDADGQNRVFKLSHGNIIAANVFVNGQQVQSGFSINNNTGVITFQTAPQQGSEIKVDFNFRKTVNVLRTRYEINPDKEVVLMEDEKELQFASTTSLLRNNGTFALDPNDKKVILFTQEDKDGKIIKNVKTYYYSDQKPGVETNYKREVVLKPKDVNNYPWYLLDKGSVQFVAEFKEDSLTHNVTIREMGLFDGPRVDDHIKGFTNYPVKAFSLVRVGEAKKDRNTGLRVTWTITLTDESGNSFTGGL